MSSSRDEARMKEIREINAQSRKIANAAAAHLSDKRK